MQSSEAAVIKSLSSLYATMYRWAIQAQYEQCAYCGVRFIPDRYDCCSRCGAPKE